MLELAILGLLKEQELHGYELKKRLADTLGLRQRRLVRLAVPGPGPPRARPARSRRSRPASRPASAIPMTGSLGGELAAFRARKAGRPGGGRGKKVYGITDRGEAALRGAAGRREPVERRRPGVQPAAGVRPLPAARRPPRHARAAPGPPARAAGPAPGPASRPAGSGRRLHPQPDRARPRGHRARPVLDRPPDRPERAGGPGPIERRRVRPASPSRHRRRHPESGGQPAPRIAGLRPGLPQEDTTP